MDPAPTPVESRAEAIQYLHTLGFHAHERNWALGETILVAAVPNDDAQGIKSWKFGLYIFPTGEGWAINDPGVPDTGPRNLSLLEACNLTAERLREAIRQWQAGPDREVQTFHGFVTLVWDFPLKHLWNARGWWTPHTRVRDLAAESIDSLLAAAHRYRLVEAKAGAELRWYPRGKYGFWHCHARQHMHPPPQDPLQPHYMASEWLDAATNDRAILFEVPRIE